MPGQFQTNYLPSLQPLGNDVSETINGSENSFTAADFLDDNNRFYGEMVKVQVLDETLYFTLDGSTPTGAATEWRLEAGEVEYISMATLLAMKFMRGSASSGTGSIRAICMG